MERHIFGTSRLEGPAVIRTGQREEQKVVDVFRSEFQASRGRNGEDRSLGKESVRVKWRTGTK